MKLAISTLGCPDWTLPEILRNVRSYGYDGVELRGLGPEIDLTRSHAFSTPAAVTQTRLAFADAGLAICSVDASASFADPEAAARGRGEAVACIDLARSLGAPHVRVFPGSLPGKANRAAEVGAMADRLRSLGEYAERSGDVILVLETHDAFSTGNTIGEVLALVGHPRVRALWDLHHPYRHGETPEQTYAALAPTVQQVHVKDSRPGGDYCLLGEGDIPVLPMLRLLRSGGYDGWLSLEWEKRWHPGLLDPSVAFPQYAAKLREYLAELSPKG